VKEPLRWAEVGLPLGYFPPPQGLGGAA
jgi:hypothetical protein